MIVGGNMKLTYNQYQSIIDYFELEPQFFTWCINNGKDLDKLDKLKIFTIEYIKEYMYELYYEERLLALMKFTGLGYKEAYNIIDTDYFVGDDRNADNEAKEYANNYLDNIVLPEIPEYHHNYFNDSEWIDDYLAEGRGPILATYDGQENYETINDTIYYIYKQ